MKYAIMFADIVGSTQLYEKLGDTIAADCVNQGLAKMSSISQKHRGTVINTIGDEIMCRFESADDAVRTACELHETFANEPIEKHNITLSLRIGIHYGEIVNRDQDVFGDVVNVAARVAAIAMGKQIITTEETIDALGPDLFNKTRRFDQIEVKGKQEKLTLHEVLWEEKDITLMRNTTSSMNLNQNLHLIYQGLSRTIPHHSAAFVLGRNPTSDLVVEASLVSRVHAYCVYRRGKFILIDQSTNGTYVKNADSRELYLRREEIPLVGRGLIGLGETTQRDNGQVIQFICM